MRVRAVIALWTLSLGAASVACSAAGLLPQYEYEEDIYLSLDGTATVYVNSSIAALDALRGASFDTNPNAMLDRAKLRKLYSTPLIDVTPLGTSRRNNRRFIHVRLDVDDVGRLSEAAPLAWSTYRFERDDTLYSYRQTIGGAAGVAVGDVGWTGREIVAFRLHLPSKIAYHNTDRVRRGNILVWEQPLADRLRGVPLTLDARMETQSILYRTLWLFATTAAAVVIMFALVLWWILRRGADAAEV